MTYTRTRPTVDGWYWMRYQTGEEEVVSVDGGWVYFPGDECGASLASVALDDAEWSGPLPRPPHLLPWQRAFLAMKPETSTATQPPEGHERFRATCDVYRNGSWWRLGPVDFTIGPDDPERREVYGRTSKAMRTLGVRADEYHRTLMLDCYPDTPRWPE